MAVSNTLLCLLVALMCAGYAHAQVDCTGLPDGSYGWGCKSYTRCHGGNGTLVDCPNDLVFNDDTGACDDPINVDAPCGLKRNCTGLVDGLHPDYEYNCTAFYTCMNGTFIGHNPCNPGTVFDPEKKVCSWPEEVEPPCGTKGTTPLKEPEVKVPKVKEPEVKKPEVKEPEVKETEVKKTEVKEPEVKETEVKEPEVKEPEVKEPEVKKPVDKKRKVKKPRVKKAKKHQQ